VKAKTHFYVCSPARRLAVLILFPFFIVGRMRSPFLPPAPPKDLAKGVEGGLDGLSAGQGQSSQPHRCLVLVLEKLQFSRRKKAKTTSWSRFDMTRDQLPLRRFSRVALMNFRPGNWAAEASLEK